MIKQRPKENYELDKMSEIKQDLKSGISKDTKTDKIRRQACGEPGCSEGRRKHSTTLEFKSPLD